MRLVALDVALLPPPDIRDLAVRLSASLPRESSKGLRLDATHLPHITLTQQFVRHEELDVVLSRIDETLAGVQPLTLHVSGGGNSGSTVWMTIEPTAALTTLHERLMHALVGLERPGGGPGAFHARDGRPGDVLWVAGYRLKSAFGSYTPHITLGHGPAPPAIAPFDFEANVVAACHLGRFCTCRRILRAWTLPTGTA